MQRNERGVGRNMRDERTIKLLAIQGESVANFDLHFTFMFIFCLCESI